MDFEQQSQRIILHIDMNSFFASVEQTANPFLRGKPIGVGDPHYENTALVAVSYEAKRKGVKGIMRLQEAKIHCPEIIVVPFDPIKYYSINRQIIKILHEYTPQVEVYSIDEAFLDLTECRALKYQTIAEIAQEIKDRIRQEVGVCLTSSVGIGANKLLAKVGSNWKKPDGLTEIPWDKRFEYIDQIPVGDIWGIGYRGTAKLTRLGISSTSQIREMPDSLLRDLVGSYYTRLKMIARGEHWEIVDPEKNVKPAKSMQHAHTLSKPTTNKEELATLIRKMSERLARRLRRHDQAARVVHLGMKPANLKEYGWGSLPHLYQSQLLATSSDHGHDIYTAAMQIFADWDISRTPIRWLVVGVDHLHGTNQLLLDLFSSPQTKKLDAALDEINQTYGEFTVRTADILHQKAKENELSVDRESMTFHPTSSE